MADDLKPSYLRDALSEPNGNGSTARLCTFLVVICALGWVSYLVVRKCAIPELGGLTLWVTGVSTSLYGVNKFAARKDSGSE